MFFKRYLLLCVIILISIKLFAFEPWKRWYIIKTEHFNIHFYEGEEKVADKIAHISEEVYS
ncbi:MAG: hypothetical protein ACPL7I_06215, partial [Myxococcota bacterium]